MKKVNCAHCGLVNWLEDIECKRCSRKLRLLQSNKAVEKPRSPTRSLFKPVRMVLVAILLVAGGYALVRHSSNLVEKRHLEFEQQMALERRRLIETETTLDKPTYRSILEHNFRHRQQNFQGLPYATVDNHGGVRMVPGSGFGN